MQQVRANPGELLPKLVALNHPDFPWMELLGVESGEAALALLAQSEAEAAQAKQANTLMAPLNGVTNANAVAATGTATSSTVTSVHPDPPSSSPSMSASVMGVVMDEEISTVTTSNDGVDGLIGEAIHHNLEMIAGSSVAQEPDERQVWVVEMLHLLCWG